MEEIKLSPVNQTYIEKQNMQNNAQNTVTPPEMKKDGDKKLKLALAGLAVAGTVITAGVLIHKGYGKKALNALQNLKGTKAAHAAQEGAQESAEQGANHASDVAQTINKADNIAQAAQNVARDTQKAAQNAQGIAQDLAQKMDEAPSVTLEQLENMKDGTDKAVEVAAETAQSAAQTAQEVIRDTSKTMQSIQETAQETAKTMQNVADKADDSVQTVQAAQVAAPKISQTAQETVKNVQSSTENDITDAVPEKNTFHLECPSFEEFLSHEQADTKQVSKSGKSQIEEFFTDGKLNKRIITTKSGTTTEKFENGEL